MYSEADLQAIRRHRQRQAEAPKGKRPSDFRVAGHAISYERVGVESKAFEAHCSCGWVSQGWHQRRKGAAAEAVSHLLEAA